MAKTRSRPHKGHAWCSCDGICVPQQLHEGFEAQLGPRVSEFNLFAWYEKRNRERKSEMIVVLDVWTQWREEFQAELRARGWVQPKKFTPKPQPPVNTERLQRLTAQFGRTDEERKRGLEQLLDYTLKKNGINPHDWKQKQVNES